MTFLRGTYFCPDWCMPWNIPQILHLLLFHQWELFSCRSSICLWNRVCVCVCVCVSLSVCVCTIMMIMMLMALLALQLLWERPKRKLTHTNTTHTHVGFYGLRGLSIGVMVFILYKLYVLLPYTYLHLNLALTGDGALLLSLKKTHSVWL